MESLVGKTLGSYRIVQRIGRGGQAEVYLAVHVALNQQRAIKVLAQHLSGNPQLVARFRREATTVAGLSHPNIVPVYDFGDQDGSLFIVMPYLGGGTLAGRLPHPDDLAAITRITSEIAAALDFAHPRGIVHRDLKPANVLFGEDGRAQVADFGIARLLQQSGVTGTGSVLGTPEYMSPEQAIGSPVDSRSDVYSLGVILYQMVTGQVPFQGDSGLSIIFQHINAPPVPPSQVRPTVPPLVEQVVLRALAKRPEQRFASAGELAAALSRAANNRPIVPDTGVTATALPLVPTAVSLTSNYAPGPTNQTIDDAEVAGLFDSALSAQRARQWDRAIQLLVEVVRRRPTGYERHGQRASALLAEAERQTRQPTLGSRIVVWLVWLIMTAFGGFAFGVLALVVAALLTEIFFILPPDPITATMLVTGSLTFSLLIAGAQTIPLVRWIRGAGWWWVPLTLIGWIIVFPLPFLAMSPVAGSVGWTSVALFLVIILGGLAGGIGQWAVLRFRVNGSGWWIPVSSMAWLIAAATWLIGGVLLQTIPGVAELSEFIPIVSLGLTFLVSLPLAATVYGGLTGFAIAALLRNRK